MTTDQPRAASIMTREDVMGLMTPQLVAELNDQIAEQSHALGGRDGACYFGCVLGAKTLCQRVKRVVRNELGLITEVEWDARHRA